MKGWIVGVLVTIGALLVVFGTLFAQSASTIPTVQLYTPINPQSSQSLILNFNMGDYSVVSPNGVWGLGMHYTYTAIERTSLNAVYVLASNATIAPAVGVSSGSFYQLNAAVTLTTTAACSGVNCAGVIENITVTLFGVIVTPLAAYQSAKSVAVFSSLSAGACTTGAPCAPSSQTPAVLANPAQPTNPVLYSFLLAVLAPFTLLVAVETFGVYFAMWKHPILPVTGIVALGALFLEFVFL